MEAGIPTPHPHKSKMVSIQTCTLAASDDSIQATGNTLSKAGCHELGMRTRARSGRIPQAFKNIILAIMPGEMRHKAAENEFTVRFREYHGTTVVRNITGLNRLDC